jgi:hypothetical protein
VILPESARKKKVEVLTRSASKPFVIAREKIVEVVPVEDALREYLDRREEPRALGGQEYDLGMWCEENGLTGPAQVHFQRAVELDPEHAEAHKKLGHVLHNGQWITYDELRKIQGLVKYKGRWVSRTEKAEIDAEEEFSSEQKSWVRRLKVLRRKWLFGKDNERPQAQEQLGAIRDPAAVTPLVHTFGADPDPVRMWLARFLGMIEGPEATEALVRLVLSEPVPEVRQATLDEVAARDQAETVPKLLSALKASDPTVVGRAAWALAGLRATAAIPRLIPVLVKVEQRMVMSAQPAQPALSAGFASINPGFTLPSQGSYAVGGAAGAIAPGGSYLGGSIPIVTGPVVGPGVVAFGATSVPPLALTGLSFGGGGVNPNRPSVEVVTQVYQNEEVLNALRTLSGVDFGYDRARWKRWLDSAYQPRPLGPVRRVPQP